MKRPLPGSEARRLLGGDDYLHFFESRAKAETYSARMPGARVLSPQYGGWNEAIKATRQRRFFVRDQIIVIELDKPATDVAKALVRTLGRAFLTNGAYKVLCWGRQILPAGADDRRQLKLQLGSR